MKGRVSKRLREKLKAAASPPTPDSAPPATESHPDCGRCGHPARYHINFAHEGKPKPPGPPDIPRKENFCRHPMSRGFCACKNYITPMPECTRCGCGMVMASERAFREKLCDSCYDELGSPLQSGAGSVGEEPDSPPASDTERACGDVATLRGWKWRCTRAEGHLGHHAVHDADEGFEIHRWARSPLVSAEVEIGRRLRGIRIHAIDFEATDGKQHDKWDVLDAVCTLAVGALNAARAVDGLDADPATKNWPASLLVSAEEPSVEQWIESRRSPDSPDIRELLDDIDYWEGVAIGFALRHSHPDYPDIETSSRELAAAKRKLEAKRCALESVFSELQNEVFTLRKFRDDHRLDREAHERQVAVLWEEVKRTQFFSDDWRETAAKYATFADSLRSELARLQAEQLTEEEANAILHAPINVPDEYWTTARLDTYSSAIEKLRAISRLRGQTND